MSPTMPATVGRPLDDLSRRIAALWAIEPCVPPERRSQLLAELGALEVAVDAMHIRSTAGRAPHPNRLRECTTRFDRLRVEWAGGRVAA